jgi:hypothetical protein
VLARRLCGRAAAEQILCGSVVVELLRGRQGFNFAAVAPLELKGFPEPVAAYEVRYQPDTGAALLRYTPFTGRTAELRRLKRRLEEARTGHGGVVLLAGEPGIGKTRTIEEVARTARAQGARPTEFKFWDMHHRNVCPPLHDMRINVSHTGRATFRFYAPRVERTMGLGSQVTLAAVVGNCCSVGSLSVSSLQQKKNGQVVYP